jgi:hypothetical protein
MIPTITNEIMVDTLDYLSQGLIAFLIYHPALGVGDYTTADQYERRRMLTMEEAVNYEVGGLDLHGYQRHIFTPQSLSKVLKPNLAMLILTPSFTALGGRIGPFTHVCFARGANVIGGRPLNGNNRGDYQGVLWMPHPVNSPTTSGMYIDSPVTYSLQVPTKVIGRVP